MISYDKVVIYFKLEVFPFCILYKLSEETFSFFLFLLNVGLEVR